MTIETLGYAFIGGLLPALIWLYFLLKEDSRCPEPRTIIVLAFIVGMLGVPLSISPQEYLQTIFSAGSFPLILSWALVEEVIKYALAASLILWRPAVDEAPDYVVYMLTTALGFAAAENFLFLIAPLAHGQVLTGLITENLRFLGSTLLHVLASSAIGFALAFSYRWSPLLRVPAAAIGLILAVVLHTAFNMLIMTTSGSQALAGFFLIWTVALVFFAAFEILKYFRYRNLPKNTC